MDPPSVSPCGRCVIELEVEQELAPSPTLRQGGLKLPGRKHLRGVGPKEQRQYEHIVESARREGRYGNRVKEVAARTVLKQHSEKGHAKGH